MAKLSDIAPAQSGKVDLAKASDSEVSQHLRVAYDKLNEVWKRAEEDLRQFPVPYAVMVCGEGDAHGFCSYLGFVKVGKDWRICYGEISDQQLAVDPDPDYGWQPITDCQTGIRLWAVRHFPRLRAEVRKEAEKAVADIHVAAHQLSSLLS